MPPKRKSKSRQSILNLPVEPSPISTPGSRRTRAAANIKKEETVPDDGTTPPAARRASKRQAKLKSEPQQVKPMPQRVKPEPISDNDEDDTTPVVKKKGGRGKGKAKLEDEPPAVSSGKGKGKAKVKNKDEPPVFPGGKRFAVVVETGPARREELKSYVFMELDVDDEAAPQRKRARKDAKGKSKAETPVSPDSDEEEEEDENGGIESSARRRRKEKAVAELNSEEEKDLKEDMAYIVPKAHVMPTRTRGARKPTTFQKKLQQLKAKREGLTIEPESDSSDEPHAALYDTDQSEFSDEEVSAANHYPREDDALEGESWIINDEEDPGTLGHPDHQIPLQYTRFSHQSPQENFKIVCTWMVQCLLNPSFPTDDEISQFALTALDRRLESWGGSVLQSSIWQPRFLRAMRARPEFHYEPCDERPICDACNVYGRTATYAVWFTGPRYDRETLLDLTESDAEDSEDSAGLEIPSEDTKFYLGRHCFDRAEMAHSFMHWKKSLSGAMRAVLTDLGYFSAKWQNKAAKMSPEERTRWADQITEDLTPQIRLFWKDLRSGLEKAENNMTFQRKSAANSGKGRAGWMRSYIRR